MADFRPPSFSLGLDLDLDSQPGIPSSPVQAPVSSTNVSSHTFEDDEDSAQQMADPIPPPALKRLRRGTILESETLHNLEPKSDQLPSNVDDEIEEFSSQEDGRTADEPSTAQHHTACSSSKLSLQGHGILTMESTNQWQLRKRKQKTNCLTSESLKTSRNKLIFPELTVSPLRKFQLIDSDSDDATGELNANATKINPSSMKKHVYHCTERKQTDTSLGTTQNEDLWKDFFPQKNFSITTPALDEICEEYFSSVSKKGLMPKANVSQNVQQIWDIGSPSPPSHRYFLHDDPMIRNLIRRRFPNFFPLGIVDNRGNQECASSIDYMSQFSHGEGALTQTTKKLSIKSASTRGIKKPKNSNAEDESWLNPKSSGSNPKNAGKRRVHADGQSCGHWYTGSDGKRVYVTRNGQELTGQIAYRHYRKENGARFKKSRKKSGPKKK